MVLMFPSIHTTVNQPGSDALERRNFLRLGTAGSLGLAAAAAAASSRRVGAACDDQAPVARGELDELTVADLQARMERGEDTARSIVEKYLARIDALDRQGPALRSVLETNPDALAIAERLDAERKAGKVRGPLHGIPVVLKDNVDTADRMTTTAGSLALEGWIPPRDACLAARLRDQGAIVLAKTNLSEWANFRSTRSTSGWSARGGLCLNPYARDRNTSGSSSGSAVAIAASLSAVGVGTETDGSIVSPANHACLVGVKPTVGLVSRSGIIPIAHSQDTAGPMTRTVRDAAILLGAMAGIDEADEATAASRGKAHRDYTQFLDPAGLKGARIGVPRKRLFGYSDAADRIAEAALDVLRTQGAVLVDPADVPNVAEIGDPEFEVLLYEFKADLNAYLARLPASAPVRSLADAIRFNEKHEDREMPYFGQQIFEMAEKKGPLTDAAYRKALSQCRRLSRTEGIDAVMAKHRLDALVMPTDSPSWVTDLINGDHFVGGSSTIAAVSGYPHITVPGGFEFGLPVGISFIGRAWSEPTLFKLAYAFEQATKHRRPPAFAPTMMPEA